LIQTAKLLLLRVVTIAKLNQFLKYYYKVLVTDQAEIRSLLNKCQFLTYDSGTNIFRINREDLSWPEKISIRRLLMRECRKISPTSIKLKDVCDTHYYDRCLERYIYERLCEYKKNEETCWSYYAQNNKCFGWYDPGKQFGTEGKRAFLKEKAIEKKRPGWDSLDLERMVRDDEGNVFYLAATKVINDDPVLSLVDKLKKYGYSNWLSIATPMILGYSTTTGRFNAISGRHRFAATRFLQRQGVISEELDIMCYVVEYPFESLAYTRPYSHECKQCMMGKTAVE
jgi:hypothetical protein